MVERWFREIIDRRIRRGVFRSVPELIAAIEEILAKVAKCKEALETLH